VEQFLTLLKRFLGYSLPFLETHFRILFLFIFDMTVFMLAII